MYKDLCFDSFDDCYETKKRFGLSFPTKEEMIKTGCVTERELDLNACKINRADTLRAFFIDDCLAKNFTLKSTLKARNIKTPEYSLVIGRLNNYFYHIVDGIERGIITSEDIKINICDNITLHYHIPQIMIDEVLQNIEQ